jgi:hypothetical protein
MRKLALVGAILALATIPTMYGFDHFQVNYVLIANITAISFIVHHILKDSPKEDMLIMLTISIIVPFFAGYMIDSKILGKVGLVGGGFIVWVITQWWDVYVDHKAVDIKKISIPIGLSIILLLLKEANII